MHIEITFTCYVTYIISQHILFHLYTNWNAINATLGVMDPVHQVGSGFARPGTSNEHALCPPHFPCKSASHSQSFHSSQFPSLFPETRSESARLIKQDETITRQVILPLTIGCGHVVREHRFPWVHPAVPFTSPWSKTATPALADNTLPPSVNNNCDSWNVAQHSLLKWLWITFNFQFMWVGEFVQACYCMWCTVVSPRVCVTSVQIFLR